MARCAPLLLLLLAAAVAEDVQVSVSGNDALSSGLKLVLRLYDDCTTKQHALVPCLKMKAISFFDRAARAAQIPLGESVVLVRNQAAPGGRAISEAELEASLPRDDGEARESRIDAMLSEKLAGFLSSHRLQIDLPQVEGTELQRSIEEGRGKMKKMMGMMMMGMAMKVAGLIPLAIAGLFVLAGKALIVSKIALVLILVIALKKLLAQKQGGGGHDSGHGWQGGGGGHGGWDRRSLDAHPLAYRAHRPSTQ